MAPDAPPADHHKTPPTIITGAQGVRIRDIDGHEVVDAAGGLWNVNLGYSCQPVKDAISAQIDALPYCSIFRGTSNDKVIELAEDLKDFFAPDGMSRAFYTSGGGDSIETALRLSRQYHKLRGEAGRVKFLSPKKGCHGTHFGAASVNGNANFRTMYEPLLAGCNHLTAPYTYRNPWGETDPAKLAQLILAELEDEIAFQGPGGVIPPHSSLMPGIAEICRRNGILLIADEVITAFGRTGARSGSRLWGVQPDFMATAKAITNGYFPFGALMIAVHVAEVFEKDETGKAAIAHGYTFSGHPVGAAAAIACLAETRRLDVASNAAARGAELFAGVQALAETHDVIGDVRGGHGLMIALELVSDRATKSAPPKSVPAKVQQVAYESGAMLRVSGANVILSPSLVVTSDDVQAILIALDAGLRAI